MVKHHPKYTNQIQADFRACLIAGLKEAFGIDESKCPVFYVGQPLPVTSQRCVTFARVGSKRVGFQGKDLVRQADGKTMFADIENWVEEITFQVNARSKETATDDVNTPTSRDIVEGLVTWIGSWRGQAEFRDKKLFVLPVKDVRMGVSTDESDMFQNVASFEVTFQVGQAKTYDHEEVELVFKGLVQVPLKSNGIIQEG